MKGWVLLALLLVASQSQRVHGDADGSQIGQDMVDEVKANTFEYHADRGRSAVEDTVITSTNTSTDLPPMLFVPVEAPSAGSPAPATSVPASNSSTTPAEAQAPKVSSVQQSADVSKEASTSYNRSWAVPAVVIVLLVVAAGVGGFIIYRRRQAARYHGLREAELGQMHRNF